MVASVVLICKGEERDEDTEDEALFFFFKHSVLPLLITYREGEHEIQFLFFTFLTRIYISLLGSRPFPAPLSPLSLCALSVCGPQSDVS